MSIVINVAGEGIVAGDTLSVTYLGFVDGGAIVIIPLATPLLLTAGNSITLNDPVGYEVNQYVSENPTVSTNTLVSSGDIYTLPEHPVAATGEITITVNASTGSIVTVPTLDTALNFTGPSLVGTLNGVERKSF